MGVDERGDGFLGDLTFVVTTEMVEDTVDRIGVKALAEIENFLFGIGLIETVSKFLVLDVILFQFKVYLGQFTLQFLDGLRIAEPVNAKRVFENGGNAFQCGIHLGIDGIGLHVCHARLHRGVDLVFNLFVD